MEEVIPENLTTPICTTDLPFSMYAYDHLKGVALRNTLGNSSEQGIISVLPNIMPDVKSVDQFGHIINVALQKVGGQKYALFLKLIFFFFFFFLFLCFTS